VHVEYEISEQDFIDAQYLAVKNSPMRLIRWSRLVLPLFGAGLLVFLIFAVARQGFSWRVIPGSIVPVGFLLMPLLNRWESKRTYVKTASLHGRLSLAVDEAGLQFQGPTFSSQIRWAHFCKFIEDQNSFLLYQTRRCSISFQSGDSLPTILRDYVRS
jgi:hypothetical protein